MNGRSWRRHENDGRRGAGVTVGGNVSRGMGKRNTLTLLETKQKTRSVHE